MIKKHSYTLANEIEILFKKYAQDDAAQLNLKAWQDAKVEAAACSNATAPYRSEFAASADKLAGSLGTLKAAGVTPEMIVEGNKALGENPEMAAAASYKEKIKAIKKFSKKYNSLKTDSARFDFLKKQGMIDEGKLIKLGMELEGKDLIKRGKIAEGKILIKMATIPGYGTGVKITGPGRLPHAAAPASPAAAPAAPASPASPAATPATPVTPAAAPVRTASWWNKIKGVGGKASKYLGKAWTFLKQYAKYLGVIIEAFMALAALLKAFWNLGDVFKGSKQVGLSWIAPILSVSYIEEKIPEYQNSAREMGILGCITNAAADFWANIVEAILSVLAAFANYLLTLAEIAITGGSAGLATAVALVLQVGGSLLIYQFKEFLKRWLQGVATESYLVTSKKINDIIEVNIAGIKPESRTEDVPTPVPPPPGGVPGESAKEEDVKAREEADIKAKEEADRKAAEAARAKEEADRKAAQEAAIKTVGLGPAVEKSNIVSIPLSSVSNNPNAAGKYIGRIKFAPVGRPKYAISLDGSNWSAIPNTGGSKPKTPTIAYLNQLGFVSPEDRTKIMESLTALQRDARSERQSLTRAERRRARKQARRVRKGKAA